MGEGYACATSQGTSAVTGDTSYRMVLVQPLKVNPPQLWAYHTSTKTQTEAHPKSARPLTIFGQRSKLAIKIQLSQETEQEKINFEKFFLETFSKFKI